MDLIKIWQQFQAMGLSGWALIICVGVVLFTQYKAGNLNFAKIIEMLKNIFFPPKPQLISMDDVHTAITERLNTDLEVVSPDESAYHSALDLIDYFHDDEEGRNAAIKCGERIFHQKQTPPSPEPAK